MTNRIQIVVTEDQAIFRKALIAFLHQFNEFEVIAEASNGKELIEVLKKQTPDIVLLDLNMPIMDGWQTFDVIKQRFSSVKVIVFSNSNSNDVVFDLIERGINSFISKSDDVDNVAHSIKQVYNNGFFLCKKLARSKQEYLANKKKDAYVFSERESQVMKEVCKGSSNNQISKKLFITPSTVDFHKQNIYKKTRSKNAIDVVRFAVKNKLFSFD